MSTANATVSRTRTTDKRFYGVVEAIVTAVEDEAGREGRVKVKYPWLDDQMETEWCRVR
ncbi:MAG: type secretion protein Rhs, partial [Firmicutes bacterium]|nr:type secretion protein Rhs [Bacillota bacterium]